MSEPADLIRETAERVRAAGMPDGLNRWLTMTPEKLVAFEAIVRRDVEDLRRPGRVAGQRGRNATDIPRLNDSRSAVATTRAAPEAAETQRVPSPEAPPPAQTEESEMSKRKTPTKSAKANSRKPVKAKTAKASKSVVAGEKTKTQLVAELLTREQGCTGQDILDATGWPSVSVPQQAKAANLTLRKDKKKGEPTRYFGTVKAA